MKRSEKTELTISKIMEAAMTEFDTNGYVGGSVNNICKSGINKGLIYHNFKDKDDLYLKCLKKSCGMLVKLIDESRCSSDLLRYMNVRMSFFKEYPNEAHIFLKRYYSRRSIYGTRYKRYCSRLRRSTRRSIVR